MPCPDADLLGRLLRGELSDGEAEPLEQHLSDCEPCGRRAAGLAETDRLTDAVRAGARVEAAVVTPPVRRLMARLHELTATPPTVSGEPGFPFLGPDRGDGGLGRLGPYRILRVLGRGGMGVVFEAEDPALKRRVAVKVLLDARHADPRYVARFRGEAEAVARLHHPNIVQIHEVGEHRGRPYLALEYVEGGNLAERLGGRPWPARQATALVEALARAVQHAHEQGVVHRDLKPANILLAVPSPPTPFPGGARGEENPSPPTPLPPGARGEEVPSPPTSLPPGAREAKLTPLAPSGRGAGGEGFGTPKIADFGLAKRLDEQGLTQTGDLLGTPGYMAPELTRGHGSGADSGPAADVYGLGAILYELLAGRPPFRGETILDTLEQVRTLEPVPVRRLQPKVPRDLETICLKCLHKEPARRYTSAAVLADDLGRFLRGEPIRARPVSQRERLAKWARRKPALAALLMVSGLSLAVLVAGGLVYNARLRAAVRRAEAKEAETRRQYQEAHATLDRMLGRLSDQRLAEVPRLKELQRDLLEDALAFYQGILQREDSPDPVVRRDTAAACGLAAHIQQVLGQRESAAENYRRAIELLNGLPAEQRDAPKTQGLLAGCYANWGVLAGGAGRAEEAERLNQKALDLWTRLAGAHPDDTNLQSELARAEHNRGAIYHKRGPAEAEPHYARAVALHTALVRDHPEEEGYQAALAEDYQDLGLLYRTAGRNAEASATFAKADDLLRPLVERHPAEASYALSLVALYVNWSYLLANTGRSQEALDRIDRGIGLAEAALRKEPQDRTAQQRAWAAHGARAEIDEFVGRFADAAKDLDRVIELQGGSAQPPRYARARVLAKAGDHARAAAAIAEVAALPETTGKGLYGLAGYYVLAIQAARRDTRLSSAERDAAVERYASRAVALLRKLQGQGYFKDAGHAKALRTDEDWQPLRDREDFRRLQAAAAPGKGG